MPSDRCGDIFCPALTDAHQLIWELWDLIERDRIPDGALWSVVERVRTHLDSMGYLNARTAYVEVGDE